MDIVFCFYHVYPRSGSNNRINYLCHRLIHAHSCFDLFVGCYNSFGFPGSPSVFWSFHKPVLPKKAFVNLSCESRVEAMRLACAILGVSV